LEFYLSALLQALCFGPLALGLFLSMKIFNIPDITTDGSYTLGAALTAVGMASGLPIPLIFIIATLGGAFGGMLTALVHTKLKINALLAGILIMTALYSINLTMMGRSNIPLLNYATLFSQLSFFKTMDLNILVILVIFVGIVLLIIGYVLKSDFGIAMRATGDSETMVRALGVNTTKMKIFGLAISNALVALSGSLIAQFQGFTDINMGIGIVISGLGSVIVGESLIALFKIKNVFFSLILIISGAFIFQFVLAFTLNAGVNPNLLKLVTAALVLVIVALPRLGFSSKIKGI